MQLVAPWANTGVVQTILGDSAFASVQTCDVTKANGLRFIGPVKTAHKGFCMKYLSELELGGRGQYHGLYTIDEDQKLDKFGFVWMDRNRMQFISNTSSLYLGDAFSRKRLRQLESTETNADPVMVQMEINQPAVTQLYYEGNAKIDEHNRTRQQVFKLEKKIHVKDWENRVNHTIMGINDVDTYRFGKAMGWWDDLTKHEFYNELIEEMIDNDMTRHPTSRRHPQSSVAQKVAPARQAPEAAPELIDTTKRRKRKQSDGTKASLPNQIGYDSCKVCRKYRTAKICSVCKQAVCND